LSYKRFSILYRSAVNFTNEVSASFHASVSLSPSGGIDREDAHAKEQSQTVAYVVEVMQ